MDNHSSDKRCIMQDIETASAVSETPSQASGTPTPGGAGAEASGAVPGSGAEQSQAAVQEQATDGTPTTDTEPAQDPDSLESLRAEVSKLRTESAAWREYDRRISGASLIVDSRATEVLERESDVEAAKGSLKTAREAYEAAVRELRTAVADKAGRRQQLPFSDSDADSGRDTSPTLVADATGDAGTAGESSGAAIVDSGAAQTTGPIDATLAAKIDVLSKLELTELVGKEFVRQSKAYGNPIGLTETHLEKLKAAGCDTIGRLEKTLREDRDWKATIGLGEKSSDRLIESLRVWRLKRPMAVSEPPTTDAEREAVQAQKASAGGASATSDAADLILPDALPAATPKTAAEVAA